MSFDLSSRKSYVPSLRESSAASGVRSDVLSSDRSGVLSGVVSSGQRVAASPPTSPLRNSVGSFPTSLPESSPESFDGWSRASRTGIAKHGVFSVDLPCDAVAVDTEPPASCLTLGFSGLKFSLTWTLNGLRR